MSALKDFLGFVINPPPGDPSRTAGSDQIGSGVMLAGRTLRPSGGDDTAQIQAAINTGQAVYLTPGTYTQAGTLDLTNGAGGALIALGGMTRWRTTGPPAVLINYTGNGNAVQVITAGGFDNYTIQGIRWDGAGSGASSIGLLLQTGNTGNTYIEGLLFERCAFTNFGLQQIQLNGQVFDITFRRLTAHNMAHGTDHVILCANTGAFAPGQLLFEDCWLVQSQNAKWAYFSDISLVASQRFVGGTVTTGTAAGANLNAGGIHALGSVELYGTHIESCSIGIDWAGTRGAQILSNEIVSNTIGVQIGSSLNGAFQATNAYVAGPNNNTTADVFIEKTNTRAGTVIGPLGLNAIVTDQRSGINGVYEVTNLNANPPLFPGVGSSLNGGGRLYSGSGAPAKPAGQTTPNVGDYYFRTDTPGTANQRIYVCTTGGGSPVWAALI